MVAPLLNEMIPREIMAESKVLCVDASEVLIDSVKGRIEREGWVGAEARVVDAQVGDSWRWWFFVEENLCLK